jgi:hypothetical protein
MPKARRTTHRSTSGKKLYAVRDSEGRFRDIQTFERAHGQDLARRSKAETARKEKRVKKKGARKKTARKPARRKR